MIHAPILYIEQIHLAINNSITLKRGKNTPDQDQVSLPRFLLLNFV